MTRYPAQGVVFRNQLNASAFWNPLPGPPGITPNDRPQLYGKLGPFFYLWSWRLRPGPGALKSRSNCPTAES
jgi:hypothetical protein